MSENNFSNNNDLSLKEEDGILLDDVKSFIKSTQYDNVLTAEEERELARRYQNGDRVAKEKFIEYNLKLVIYMAKKYRNNGLPFVDLIQEGNIGLLIAVDKYNPDLGYRFGTYAGFWIKQSIVRAIANKGKMIRLPLHIHRELYSYMLDVNKLSKKLCRVPTSREISQELNLPLEKVLKNQALIKPIISLNKTVDDESDDELGNLFTYSNDNVEATVCNNSLKDEINKIFDKIKFSERTKEILRLIFGFDGEPMTLDEIGEMYGVSRQRIHQIETESINKIRRNRKIME